VKFSWSNQRQAFQQMYRRGQRGVG